MTFDYSHDIIFVEISGCACPFEEKNTKKIRKIPKNHKESVKPN